MFRAFLCLVSGCFLLSSHARAEDPHHEHHDDHMHHEQPKPGYLRSSHDYRLPDVRLVDQNGRATGIAELLTVDSPVMINVIYTSCTSVCPVMTSVFARARQLLGPEANDITMLSITNDPEHDTPEVLASYTRSHHAPWRFLTGNRDDIAKVLRAFDADRGGKMNHVPLTFLRTSRNAPWIRLEGLTTAQQLVQEYRQQLARR